MSELKLNYKTKKVKEIKEVKQDLQKHNPTNLNLIDIYMGISLSIFPNKNIKRKDNDV